MTHKNWDNVRDHRVYAYMNEAEKAQFFEAMRIKDISQQGTALRQFALAHAEQIIITSRQPIKKPKTLPTVMVRFLDGASTVIDTVVSTVKQ